jgi:hypothetical protein
VRPSQWLRSNSEHYLMEAAQRRLAVRYLGKASVPPLGMRSFFWRRIFVPVYTWLPWALRHSIIRGMPGSHRQRWRAFDAGPRHPGI